MDTDGLVLYHQVISSYSAEYAQPKHAMWRRFSYDMISLFNYHNHPEFITSIGPFY